jgi:hypothetical protein
MSFGADDVDEDDVDEDDVDDDPQAAAKSDKAAKDIDTAIALERMSFIFSPRLFG